VDRLRLEDADVSDARMLEATGARRLEGSGYLALEAPPSTLAAYSDDFTYSNGRLTTVGSAKWASAAITGHTSPDVASNAVTIHSGETDNAALYNATFAANQYAQADVVASPGGAYPAVIVRGHTNSEWMRLGVNTGSILQLYSHIGSTWTDVNEINVGATSGTLRLEVVGTTYRAFWNGVQKLASIYIDSAVAGGTPGVYVFSNGTVDNWAGGELAATTFPLTDNFTRANTTATSAGGAGLGDNWVGDSYVINSNTAARTTSGNDDARFMYDLGSDDHWVEATITGQDTYFTCLNVRGKDTALGGATFQNMYLAFIGPGNNTLEIGKVVNGSYATVTTAAAGGRNGKQRLQISGSTISFYLNDVLVTSTTDTSITAGHYVGLNTGPPSTLGLVTYDNFRCGPLPYTP